MEKLVLEKIISSPDSGVYSKANSNQGIENENECGKNVQYPDGTYHFYKSIEDSVNAEEGKIDALKSERNIAYTRFFNELEKLNPLVGAGLMGAYSAGFMGLGGFLAFLGEKYFENSMQFRGGAVGFCIATAAEGAFFCIEEIRAYKKSGRSSVKDAFSKILKANEELKTEKKVLKSLKSSLKQKA
ncbi:MAG: hypothetical protein NTV63_00325 [Candidatus Woesearchaeota archaeon]|nr:hypothetical protein [Candidatus Woesearchaeota archaeon]